jgi:hypothetical protein
MFKFDIFNVCPQIYIRSLCSEVRAWISEGKVIKQHVKADFNTMIKVFLHIILSRLAKLLYA